MSLAPHIAELFSWYDKRKEKIEGDFFQFLRFQSISSEPEFKMHVQDCCNWLAQNLRDMGLTVEVWKTAGHPIIYAEWMKAGPEKPTVLIYNHYDVQPVDPLALWETPPFEPTVRDGEVYARGAQDNKGQCMTVISAVQVLLQERGSLPLNVKLIIEGEEEMGSVQLSQNLESYKKKLRADHLIIVDVGLHEKEIPSVTLGIRGLVTMSVELQGSNTDLHSGSHGGIVYNPNRALVELLGSLYDKDGKVTVPGFYDDVAPVSAAEKELLHFHFDEEKYKNVFSAMPCGGEKDYSPLESAWLRPTLEINGLNGGYSGDGFKTVIPAKATAKISCRLVPHQDPMRIGKLVADYLAKHVPDGIQLHVEIHPGVGAAVRTSPEGNVVKAAAQAFAETFDKPCHYILDGATIPVVTELAKKTGAEVVLIGQGLPGDRIHAPNEHFGLDRLRRGFVTIARTLEILGE